MSLRMAHLILIKSIISASILMIVLNLLPKSLRLDLLNQTVFHYLILRVFLNMKLQQMRKMSHRKIRVVLSMKKLWCRTKNRIIWHRCSISMNFIRSIIRVQLIQISIQKMLLMIENYLLLYFRNCLIK